MKEKEREREKKKKKVDISTFFSFLFSNHEKTFLFPSQKSLFMTAVLIVCLNLQISTRREREREEKNAFLSTTKSSYKYTRYTLTHLHT